MSPGNPNDSSLGVAGLDPTAHLTRPVDLTFKAIRLGFEGEAGSYMPIAAQRGLLLALSFRDDLGHHTTGSAVMVGPGLALCATHVLEDDNYLVKLRCGDAGLVAQAPTDLGLLLWTVKQIVSVPKSDLSVLSLELSCDFPADLTFNHAEMTTRMPAVGDDVMVTGFTAVQRTQQRGQGIEIKLRPGCVRGRVTDLFPTGRDRVMLPGPCFGVECNATGGMSGGSVFDSRGCLVGVVSSSYEGVETTFVSHLWPALVGVNVQPVWPANQHPNAATLLYMGRKFAMVIDRPDAFSLSVINRVLAFNYHQWS